MVSGVDDGARTHDRRDHNPELYQLSYVHHRRPTLKTLVRQTAPPLVMARPAGLEPATLGLEGRCSIRLSYGRIVRGRSPDGRGRGIRTPDPLLPKQMRYQTAPCPALYRQRPAPCGSANDTERAPERQFA